MKYLKSIFEYLDRSMLNGDASYVNFGNKEYFTGKKYNNTKVIDTKTKWSESDNRFYTYDIANEIVKDYYALLNKNQDTDLSGFDPNFYNLDLLTDTSFNYMIDYLKKEDFK